MQQQIEYQEAGIQQLTQEGMRQLAEAGYGIYARSVHNDNVLVFVRVVPQALPAPQEPPQNDHRAEPTPIAGEVLEMLQRTEPQRG